MTQNKLILIGKENEDIKTSNILIKPEIELFLLSLFFGIYSLLGLISIFLPDGINEKEKTILFVSGWIIVPLFSIIAAFLFRWIKNNYLNSVHSFYLIMLSIYAVMFSIVLTAINLTWQLNKSYSQISRLTDWVVFAFPLLTFLVLLFLKFIFRRRDIEIGNRVRRYIILEILLFTGIGFLNFVGFFPYFYGQDSLPFSILWISILAGLFSLLFTKSSDLNLINRLVYYGMDLIIILVSIIACFDPQFSILISHQNFYLGPVNRLLNGGTMLVDTYSQYGVVVIYFLALLLKSGLFPFTYQGFSLIISILLALQFSTIYILLLAMLKDRYYAFSIQIVVLLLGLFGTVGIMQAFPSTGPLRFGLSYVILFIVMLRRRYPRLQIPALVFETIFVGIASLWSFETFIYTAFTYLGICIFENLIQEFILRKGLSKLLLRLLLVFGAVVFCQGIFALFTYSRSGSWPNWSIYFNFIFTYSLGGFGVFSIDAWSPWIFPIAIYFTSLMVFLYRYIVIKRRDTALAYELAFGMTFLGIAESTYYLNRSDPNNLFHVCAPAVILAGYWVVKIVKNEEVHKNIRLSVKFYSYSAIALILFAVMPSFVMKYQNNHTGYSFIGNAISMPYTENGLRTLLRQEKSKLYAQEKDPQVNEAVDLILKYSPGKKDVTIFISPEKMTEILILANRVHSFPIADMEEDNVSSSNSKRILNYDPGLKENDIVYLAEDPAIYKRIHNDLEIELINNLCSKFSFQEIEHSPDGIAAMKLEHLINIDPYCETIAKINIPKG
jgi:hypothetical protein